MADPAKALDEARLAVAEAEKLPLGSDRALAEAQANWLQSAALIGLHRSAESLAIARATLQGPIARIAPHSKLLGNLHMTVGGDLLELGRIEEALREFQRANDTFAAAGEPRNQAIALQAIGSTYLIARDFAHGTLYYAKSAATFPGDPSLQLSANYNVGLAYLDQGKPKQAVEQLDKALSLATKLKSPLLEGRVLGDLASAQLAAGDDAAAAISVRQGLAIVARGQSGDWSVRIYRAAAQKALKDGRLDPAVRLIEQAFGAVKGGMSTLLLRDVQRTAFDIYKARGDTAKALAHFEEYKRLDDQARTTAASANAALIATQFDFANQRAANAQLLADKTQNEVTIARNQRTIVLILLAGSGLVTVLLLFGFISIRRSRDQVRAANSELSETNAELEDALAARTQFLATTSHEIRTPLNGILGMTQVLLADRALEPDVKSKIELVHGAGETMRALVDDILDVAKMTTGELVLHPEPMNLHRLLRDTVQVWTGQAQSKGVTIVAAFGDCPERIVQDEVRLRQIVFNLIANAVKFTDRGEVRLATACVAAPGEREELQIRVKDTGIGIPTDKLEEIFESFRQVDSGTTRRHSGSGLGLAICRNLAKAMGGDISVESVLGAGATFTLRIPLERVEAATAAGTPVADTLGAARLLLVEANPLNQSILRAVLTPKVTAIAVAGNVEEAEATIADADIDLLLLDANTLGRDMSVAARLAEPVRAQGGRAVILWPTPDESIFAAAAEANLTKVFATPLSAPDLVSALTALYVEQRPPAEIAA